MNGSSVELTHSRYNKVISEVKNINTQGFSALVDSGPVDI